MSLPPQHSFPPPDVPMDSPTPQPPSQQQQQQQQQHAQAPPTPAPADHPSSAPPSRKRKKGENGEPAAPAEPRRLRRSHEACARCRSKKIKCDSKHPRCTACATAGTPCHQEDRHRQTLTPRGYTERLERQLAQCEMLLKRRIPDFDMANIEETLIKEGLPLEPSSEAHSLGPSAAFQFQSPPPPPPPNSFPPPPPP
ncbi:hypothetical protein K488DRAFT_73348, partial [Vararia minispora EC-137]